MRRRMEGRRRRRMKGLEYRSRRRKKEKENGREEKEKKEEDGMEKQEKESEKEEKKKKKKKKIERENSPIPRQRKCDSVMVVHHNNPKMPIQVFRLKFDCDKCYSGHFLNQILRPLVGFHYIEYLICPVCIRISFDTQRWEEYLKDRKEREEEYHKKNERSQEEEQAKKTTDPNRQKEQEEIIARLNIEIKRLCFRMEFLHERVVKGFRNTSKEVKRLQKELRREDKINARLVGLYGKDEETPRSSLDSPSLHSSPGSSSSQRWTNAEQTSVKSFSTLYLLKEIPLYWKSRSNVCGFGYGTYGLSASRAIERKSISIAFQPSRSKRIIYKIDSVYGVP
ncbi:uncharacterized protein [Palaemon carinicauda]|uniref:uncharacterized protein n=1 Tax=Palaemon carinicauda TaxID=392227 RepID=UPI0035B59972